MSKFNLSEAAAEILQKSKANAGSESFGLGKKLAADEQGEVEIGTAGHKTTDSNYDATKGVPRATPPGQTSPVGSEPMKKLSNQPQQSQGRKDLAGSPEGSETSADDIVNRKKATLAKQTMPSNPSAKVYAEDDEDEDFVVVDDDYENEQEELEEATIEEVEDDFERLSHKGFYEKYSMTKKDAKKQLYPDSDGDSGDSCKYTNVTKGKMKEDIDALLFGENLSEDFKQKATLIFEAAVESRVEQIALQLEEKFEQEFEESLEIIKEDFGKKIDDYLDYVIKEWIEENKIAIEKGLRTEIAEDFMEGLKNLFTEHYIDIPEDKVDIVEQLVDKVEELEEQVNTEMLKNIDLKKSLSEHQKLETIQAVCEGLTLTQVEKIKSLARNIEFVSEDDFTDKVAQLKESYFPNDAQKQSVETLNESVELDDSNETYVDPTIARYAKTISKLTKF